MKRTEERAEKIFAENNKMVIDKLAAAGARVDEVEAYHEVQRLRSEALFAKNEECIKTNMKI